MDDLATRCLKYGDTIYLKADGKQSYVSAQDRATPQIRTDDLSDAADCPPDLKDCLFEVTKKYQYTAKKLLANELARYGLVPEDALSSDALSAFEEHVNGVVTKPKERHRMVSLFNAYLREKRTNDNEFKQVVGESILYGQVVQLRHLATGKFVTIKRTAADVERGALKVVLDEGGQEGSWFQVFSGYRTKPEGAKLMPGEVVAFKGLAFSGNGLHISSTEIDDPVMLPSEKHPYVTAVKEVCASPDVSALKVIPFTMHEKVFPAINERLCGMNSVSIQDLVANTVYINILGAHNDKYLYFENPLTRPDPNRVGGPDCWRIELVQDGGFWCGMPVMHGSQIRIRHLPTGCYLAAISTKAKEAAKSLRERRSNLHPGHDVATSTTPGGGVGPNAVAPLNPEDASDDVLYDEAFRLVLTKRYNVPDTLWELNTFTREEVVGTKVYAFFKHVATQFWLSGAGPPIPLQSSKDPDDPQEEQMYPVVHPEKLERNVMLVLKLPDDFTCKVLALQRVMVQLRDMRYVLHKEKIPLEAELLAMVHAGNEDKVVEILAASQYPDKFRLRYPALKRSLKELVRWLDKNTWNDSADAVSPHIEYQNLLRELGMIDQLVQYMESARVRLFATTAKLCSTRLGKSVVDSGKQCHKVLQLACQGNETNQAFLAKYASMVMSHLSLPVTAPDTLAAMYEDNMAQMQTVSPQIVRESVQLIRAHGYKPRFINFLRQISGTRERPMPNNQNWIVAEVIGSGHDPRDVFCRAGVATLPDPDGRQRETWAIWFRRKDNPSVEIFVDAAEFANVDDDLTKRTVKEWELSGDDSLESNRELFVYYCTSLKFIVSLCYGRNSLARKRILDASRTAQLGLEFELLRTAIVNKSLPYCMRSYMVQVIRALYVDIESYRPLKIPRHVRMMSKKGPTRIRDKVADSNRTIPDLISTVLDQLRQAAGGEVPLGQHKQDDSETLTDERGERTVGRNVLLHNYLKLVHEMFLLGMMELDSPMAKETLMVLLEIIQKVDSLPLDRPERFKRSYASRVVMQAKKVALQTIDFALDMKSEQQCSTVFEKFAEWQRSDAHQEYWARKQTEQRAAAAKAAAGGGRASGPRVRTAASLGFNSKVAPMPGDPAADPQAADPEAPPPRNDEAGDVDGEPQDYGGLLTHASQAAILLAADNEEGDFPLFKLDTLRDTEPLYRQNDSPIVKLFDLVRYDDQDLTARAFQLLERLTSKREKLLEELMRTFVVTDDDLTTLATMAVKQIEIAEREYNFMGSLDPEESRSACRAAAAAIGVLKSMLMPLQHVQGGSDRVFVSKTTAANGQYMMYDVQVHLMVLKFLKLPLRRKPNPDPHQLQEADDPDRLAVFKACLEFLRHFMVVGDLDASNVASHANQAAVLPSLELLLSFLDTRDLPVSDTIIALFINNKDDAAAEGERVIRKLVKLITRYGDKKHAGWLELLGKVMVVNGSPIKRNQMAAMQLITQFSDDLLSLFSDAGLDELRALLGSETLTARPCAEPPVSTLAYHTACIQLLADCCAGKEPELVVRASGYMSLAQVLDVLLLQPSPEASEINLRYVQRAYWRLLQHCYFATDTDNTKVQVRNGANRVWPLDQAAEDGGPGGDGGAASLLLQRFLDIPTAAARKQSSWVGGSCLMQSVLEEVRRALGDPSDALANADSATFFLTLVVFPALNDYFENHWSSHVAKLPSAPNTLLAGLFNAIMDLYESLKRTQDGSSSLTVKAELKVALTNTRALLRAMPPEANVAQRGLQSKTLGKTSAPSSSQQSTLTVRSQKAVHRDWMMYLRRLADQVSVQVNPHTYEIVEVLHSPKLFAAAASTLGMGEAMQVFEQASLLRLARMLAAKFGRLVPGSNPPMCFEELIAMLCELLASRSVRDKGVGPQDWKPALMVKMVRTVCAAAVLDDGAGAENEEFMRNAWASLGLVRAGGEAVAEKGQPSAALLAWRQAKYDKLDATRAAVTLLAHPMPEVQLEALQLLEVLLKGGNRVVQASIYEILKDGSELADTVFANVKAAFDRCRKYVSRRVYTPKREMATKKVHIAAEAAKAVAGAVTAIRAGGSKFIDVAGVLGNKVRESLTTAPPSSSRSGTVRGGDRGSRGKVGLTGAGGTSEAGSEGAASRGSSLRNLLAPTASPSQPPPPPPNPSTPFLAMQPQLSSVSLPQQLQQPQHSMARAPSGGGSGALQAVPEGEALGEAQAAAKAASTRVLVGSTSRLAASSSFNRRASGSNGPSTSDEDGAVPATPPGAVNGAGSSRTLTSDLAVPGVEVSAPLPRRISTGVSSSSRGCSSRRVSGEGRGTAAGGEVGECEGEDEGRRGVEVLQASVSARSRFGGEAEERRRSSGQPVAEGAEADDSSTDGGKDEGDEDEDEIRWEEKVAKLNAADSAYEFTSVLLRVLQSMVEGHYKSLQTILQLQPNSTSSLDLVVEAVDLLNVLQDNLPSSLLNDDHEVADLMVLVCTFVQEMVQGPCPNNQQSLAGTNFLATCNRIFGCIEYSNKYNPRPKDFRGADRRVNLHKCRLKRALLNLLSSLLEASPSEDIPSRCYDILDFDVIDRQIARLCKVLGMAGEGPRYPTAAPDVVDCDNDELINIATKLEDELLLFCSYVLKLRAVTPSRPPPLPYIADLFKGEDVDKMDSLTPEQQLYAAELQAFLQRRLGYVEINWKGQLIEPVFFALTPECSNLVTSTVWCEATLDRINNTVSPDSRAFPTVKAAELVEVLEDVVDDITLEAKLTRTKWLKIVSAISRYRLRLLELTFYLAVGTLIFQALADARWSPDTSFLERGDDWRTIVLSVSVMLQSTCTVLLYVCFVYTNLNKHVSHEVPRVIALMNGIAVKLRLRAPDGSEPGGSGRGGDGGGGNKDGAEEDAGGASAAMALGLPPPPLDERRGWWDLLQFLLALAISTVTYPSFWYFNMLVSASLAGFFVSPFFLVFHFTIYFLDFDSGKQLVMAIQRSGINILNTFVLAVLAIYVFAVVTFLVFKDPTRVDKGDGPPCDTFYQCMGAHMLTGIYGDISSLFNSDLWDTVPEQVDEDGLQQARTIFVLTFFMIWNFVLSNIFVGLIASAFEAIRDDQNTITSDRLSKCLICSQDMYLFNELIQGGFDEHILKQHNALSYVYFVHHLRATAVEDYTGAESAVAHVLDSAKTTTDKGTWLPVSKSLAVMHAQAAKAHGQ